MLGITGPASVNAGETVALTCRYDLGREAIYSIKWYKDDKEIYRYVPADSSEFKYFNIPGVDVDVSEGELSRQMGLQRTTFQNTHTRPNQLVIKVTGPLGSGEYRCEITVETPTFVTLDKVVNLTVVVPPRLAPQITGIDSFYSAGDLVEVTCSSRDSKPAVSLKWKLNGEFVSSSLDLSSSFKKTFFSFYRRPKNTYCLSRRFSTSPPGSRAPSRA